ncbi:MAG: hypothetical protein Q4B69_01530 [Slackia sp.]|nr:hypothetical protein [Slackia sp.]
MAENKRSEEAAQPSFWRGLFDDISIAQLLAGALAAVTSMLLASRIGITGSVIGVAVGSIVSAVASQVYKKFLSASAEKIKDMAPDLKASSHGADVREPQPCDSSTQTSCRDGFSDGRDIASAETTVMRPHPDLRAADETVAFRSQETVLLTHGIPSAQESKRDAEAFDLYADSARARSRAARLRKSKIQRNAAIVAAVSALVAIALTAVVIEAVTAGQGVGAKPASPSGISWHAPANGDADQSADASAGVDAPSDAAPAPSSQPDDASQGDSSKSDASSDAGSQDAGAQKPDAGQDGAASGASGSQGGSAGDSSSQGQGSGTDADGGSDEGNADGTSPAPSKPGAGQGTGDAAVPPSGTSGANGASAAA